MSLLSEYLANSLVPVTTQTAKGSVVIAAANPTIALSSYSDGGFFSFDGYEIVRFAVGSRIGILAGIGYINKKMYCKITLDKAVSARGIKYTEVWIVANSVSLNEVSNSTTTTPTPTTTQATTPTKTVYAKGSSVSFRSTPEIPLTGKNIITSFSNRSEIGQTDGKLHNVEFVASKGKKLGWYKITTPANVVGYCREDVVTFIVSIPTPLPKPTSKGDLPTNEPTPTPTDSSSSNGSATPLNESSKRNRLIALGLGGLGFLLLGSWALNRYNLKQKQDAIKYFAKSRLIRRSR